MTFHRKSSQPLDAEATRGARILGNRVLVRMPLRPESGVRRFRCKPRGRNLLLQFDDPATEATLQGRLLVLVDTAIDALLT